MPEVANKPESVNVWQGQTPEDFAADLARAQASYQTCRDLAVAADTDNSGDTDTKADAETLLEKLTLQMAAALRNHYKKTGNTTNRAKVVFPKRALVRLRDRALVTRCTEIRDLALEARDESGAGNRGVTFAKIQTLTAALDNFDNLSRQPVAAIKASAGKRRDLKTETADLMDQLSDLDDLVVQFEVTIVNGAPTPAFRTKEAIRDFVNGWFDARKIIDAGHGPGEDAPANPPTPPPANPPTPPPANPPTP